MNISFPEPTITPITKPFWDSMEQKKFNLQRCEDCKHWIFYPRAHCPHCFGNRLTWQEATGKGRLKTWSIVHRASHPAWQSLTPYAVGIVELEEGPSMLTHLLIRAEELHYQLPVEISYHVLNERQLPFFKKRGGA
ncbi:Zn-ribbon domain-containing OB-fold protein [Gracilibacillus salinarum]|uniref:OB-fold domain-containing protein n=1 Tax=Gracilibacillus salinarum TaxID=2932255 RepID=A0ABY4GJZ1_9BACI|nr:OB-fold domain-containing protein [Gracilibacillus salinarum]UOQ84509.1 OB-fold domain-containing protein [Gracilibacillus salinarum]